MTITPGRSFGAAYPEGPPRILLADGNAMPQVGLGVFNIGASAIERSVFAAFEAGYRGIDTAELEQVDKIVEYAASDDRQDAEIVALVQHPRDFRGEAERRAFRQPCGEANRSLIDPLSALVTPLVEALRQRSLRQPGDQNRSSHPDADVPKGTHEYSP